MAHFSEADIIIIGAGAAGLGAAHRLKDSNLSVLVLEARDRIGGRAHTLQFQNIIFDEGCGWLHAADLNSFVPIANELDFEISKEQPPWEKANAGFGQNDRSGFGEAMDAFYARLHSGAKSGVDVPASAWLEPGNRWNTAINSASTYINGCELDLVSTLDIDSYKATGKNWRIKRGYGALIAAYGASCPVMLQTKVTNIDHSVSPLKLETSRGVLRAKAIILSVSTNLIANETIRFSPMLPEKQEAACGLPLGLADKVMLAVEEVEDLPNDGYLNVALNRLKKGSYHLHPLGQPCIEGYFGGAFAHELEDAGKGALAAQAIDEIVDVLGSDFRRKLKPLGASRWARDSFAQGSYSYSRPGHSGDRIALATPVDGRIFFAGEATSPNFFSTAHGARDSGQRAAEEALKFLKV
jgi:monoamine oxidase